MFYARITYDSQTASSSSVIVVKVPEAVSYEYLSILIPVIIVIIAIIGIVRDVIIHFE